MLQTDSLEGQNLAVRTPSSPGLGNMHSLVSIFHRQAVHIGICCRPCWPYTLQLEFTADDRTAEVTK